MCRFHEFHGICHLNFSHLIFRSLSFGCMFASIQRLELFALICLLFTTNAFALERFFDSRNHLALSPLIHNHTCTVANVGCWFACDVFIPKRKTVMWLLWIRQMVFGSSSTTNAMHCIQTTKYTWHAWYCDGDNDNDGNSNSSSNTNSSLYRMQVPISKSAYK